MNKHTINEIYEIRGNEIMAVIGSVKKEIKEGEEVTTELINKLFDKNYDETFEKKEKYFKSIKKLIICFRK